MMAVSKKQLEENLAFGEDLFCCTICLEQQKDPKVLPCLHSFCSVCIRRHFEVYRLSNSGRLSCPACRELFGVPATGVLEFRDDVTSQRVHEVIQTLFRNGGKQRNSASSHEEAGAVGGAGSMEDGAEWSELTLPPGVSHEEGWQKYRLQQHLRHIQLALSKMRTKTIQLQGVETHIHHLIENEISRNCGGEVAKCPAKRAELRSEVKAKYSATLKQLASEEDRIYNELVDLRSAELVLNEVVEKCDNDQIIDWYPKLIALVHEVQPIVEYFNDTGTGKDAKAVAIIGIEDLTAGLPAFDMQKVLKPMAKPDKKKKIGCRLVFQISGRGTGHYQFDFPTHATFMPDGSILVSDKNNMRLKVFSNNGQFIRNMLRLEIKPRRARMNPKDGLIYVSDELSESVKVYDFVGNLVRRIGEGFFQCPAGMDFDSKGRLVMTDAEKCFVSVLKQDGEPVTRFYFRFLTDPRIPNPYFATVNEDDQIIVTDYRNNIFKVFSQDGSKVLLRVNKLKCPRGVCVDPYGNILIAEGDKHCISMYSPHGKFLQILLGEEDGLHYPMSLDMNDQGQILITQFDHYNRHELLLFQMN